MQIYNTLNLVIYKMTSISLSGTQTSIFGTKACSNCHQKHKTTYGRRERKQNGNL